MTTRIPAWHVPGLKEALEKYNKRLAKYGLPRRNPDRSRDHNRDPYPPSLRLQPEGRVC